MDGANRQLLAVTGCSSTSSSARHAAFCPPAARLGPPHDGLASDADVAGAPSHAARSDAGVGSPAAAGVPPVHEAGVHADSWDSLHGNADGACGKHFISIDRSGGMSLHYIFVQQTDEINRF